MPGGPAVQIEFEGLKQLRKDLAAVDKKLVKELGQAYKTIGQMIVSEASSRAAGVGGVAAKSARALTATARATDVSIRINGEKYPWALGGEFGGGPPRSPQFKPWRGNGPEAGYFLYPTIRSSSQKILDGFLEAFDKASQLAFPKK